MVDVIVAIPGFHRNVLPGATGPFGPTDYDRLVAAKQDIANGMSTLVDPILQPGPVDTFYREDARDSSQSS